MLELEQNDDQRCLLKHNIGTSAVFETRDGYISGVKCACATISSPGKGNLSTSTTYTSLVGEVLATKRTIFASSNATRIRATAALTLNPTIESTQKVIGFTSTPHMHTTILVSSRSTSKNDRITAITTSRYNRSPWAMTVSAVYNHDHDIVAPTASSLSSQRALILDIVGVVFTCPVLDSVSDSDKLQLAKCVC